MEPTVRRKKNYMQVMDIPVGLGSQMNQPYLLIKLRDHYTGE